jgi:hypothetical protein
MAEPDGQIPPERIVVTFSFHLYPKGQKRNCPCRFINLNVYLAARITRISGASGKRLREADA